MMLFNDDVQPPSNRNSRLVFAPPRDGNYRVVVSSINPEDTGAYTLKIEPAEPAGKQQMVQAVLKKSKKTLRGKFV